MRANDPAPLWQRGLRDLITAVRADTDAAACYARACMARLAATEPQLNAWAWYEPAAALGASAAADYRGALAGAPIGVKDIIDTRGIPTRMGSAAYADNVPSASALIVRRLEAAGGFVMGKTVTAELAYYTPGPTRNPWNAAHTPGGSSSGSAAAVAAGVVPLALGTQTNGSVIRPAAFCGCVGFKPSAGYVPRSGILRFSETLDQVGVFARSVTDAALLAGVLAGPDASDPTTRELPSLGVPAPLATRPRLIAVRTPRAAQTEAYALAHFAEVLDALRAAGARVDERELPSAFERGYACHRTLMYGEGARALVDVQRERRAQLSDPINALIDEGRNISDAALAAARTERTALVRALEKFLRDADAIVTLPAPGEAPATLTSTGDPAFCTLWTLCGAPALTLPTGVGPRRLPLGTQWVGAPEDDSRLLAVAHWAAETIGFNPSFP